MQGHPEHIGLRRLPHCLKARNRHGQETGTARNRDAARNRDGSGFFSAGRDAARLSSAKSPCTSFRFHTPAVTLDNMVKSLPVPAPAKRDPRAVEMLRSWIAQDKLHVVVNIGFWERPEQGRVDERDAWGILLADTARHIANAHEEEYGRDPRETLTFIAEAFERELAKPTSTHSGKFVRRSKPPKR